MHLGTLNPLRYRGYVYDTETGLYYLQSRYYNPTWGRFISADNYPSTGQGLTGNNMFAYCGNNPVSRADDGGEFWEAIVIGFVAGFVGQYVSDVIDNIQSGKNGVEVFSSTSSLSDYLASGVGGAIAAIPGLNGIGTIVVGAIGNIVSEGLKGNIRSAEDIAICASVGGMANGLGFLASKGLAALKIKQIGNMSHSAKKAFFKTNYCVPQKYANSYLQIFDSLSMNAKIEIIEDQFLLFSSGFYSTVTYTLGAVIYGGVS